MSPKSSWGKVENEKMSKKAVICKRRQFFSAGVPGDIGSSISVLG